MRAQAHIAGLTSSSTVEISRGYSIALARKRSFVGKVPGSKHAGHDAERQLGRRITTPVNAAALELVNRATTEPDPTKRKQIYSDLNDMLLDEVYIICMSPTTNRLITTSKVHGAAPTLHSAQKWWEVWLADQA